MLLGQIRLLVDTNSKANSLSCEIISTARSHISRLSDTIGTTNLGLCRTRDLHRRLRLLAAEKKIVDEDEDEDAEDGVIKSCRTDLFLD